MRKSLPLISLCFFASVVSLLGAPSSTIKMVSINGMDAKMSLKVNRMQGPFYFVDAPLTSVLSTLELLLDRPIIYSSNLPQKATFTFKSEKKIPHEDAIKIFSSMLSLNGIALIPVDNDKYYKAVPAAGVSSQIPEFLVGRASDQKPSQKFYTKFFELKHIQVSDIEGKLKSSLSPNNVGMFETFPKSNSFWVTDSLINLQRIETLLDKLDIPLVKTEFVQVKNASASEIKDKLLSLNLDDLKNAKIVADTRTNKIVVVASEEKMVKINGLIKELDVESDAILKSEVVYVKHGEAAKVVEVLSKIVSGQKQTKRSGKDSYDKKNPNVSDPKNTKKVEQNSDLSKESSPDKKDDRTGIEFSDYVQIVSEERSNAIVIYGTSSDLRQIKSIIEKLDIVLTQVKIDVLITEVVLSNNQVSGLSSFGLNYNTEKNSGFSGTTKTYNLTDASTPAFSISASENSFSMLFDVARQNQNVKVLSSPTIVTTHNKEAEINISQSLPIITSSMSDMASVTTTRSSVSYKDIGIRLIVTPLVGAHGSIQLKIDQSVDSISGYTTIDNNQQPIISKRKATSFVSAKDSEIITLAGLQQVDTTEIDGGVWLLSDIPIIGEIFKPAKNDYKRRELIIFIRPSVIESVPGDEILKDSSVAESEVKKEIQNFVDHKKFYPERELEEKANQFESQRTQNRMKETLRFK